MRRANQKRNAQKKLNNGEGDQSEMGQEKMLQKSTDQEAISVKRDIASNTIRQIIEEHPGACVLMIGPDSLIKSLAMECFINDYHCYVGGDPSWLLNNSAEAIRESLSNHCDGVTVFDVRESEVTTPELRTRMVKKLTEAGFSEIIGMYVDNSCYLALEHHMVEKYVAKNAEQKATDDEPNLSAPQSLTAPQFQAAITQASGMNEVSKAVCLALLKNPPDCSEFSGGMIRLRPTWAAVLA